MELERGRENTPFLGESQQRPNRRRDYAAQQHPKDFQLPDLVVSEQFSAALTIIGKQMEEVE